MANRKRNIAFARPEEPEFIKKLKQRAGITRGPDIETKVMMITPKVDATMLITMLFKLEALPKAQREDLEDKEEEHPVIVVLKNGDLTEEQVNQINEENKIKRKSSLFGA